MSRLSQRTEGIILKKDFLKKVTLERRPQKDEKEIFQNGKCDEDGVLGIFNFLLMLFLYRIKFTNKNIFLI